jgi:hypothetical protein
VLVFQFVINPCGFVFWKLKNKNNLWFSLKHKKQWFSKHFENVYYISEPIFYFFKKNGYESKEP